MKDHDDSIHTALAIHFVDAFHYYIKLISEYSAKRRIQMEKFDLGIRGFCPNMMTQYG